MEVVGNPFATTHGLDKKTYAQMITEIQGKGVKLYTLPPKEEERWFTRFQEVTRKWVAEMEKQGKPAKEAVMMYTKIVEQAGSKCVAAPPSGTPTERSNNLIGRIVPMIGSGYASV